MRAPLTRRYPPRMPIEPPDPLRLAEVLRVQLDPLAELLAAYPERAELVAALNNVAGAVSLLERTARIGLPTVRR